MIAAEVFNLVLLVLLDYARTHDVDWRGPEKRHRCVQLTTIHKSSAYGINFLLSAPSPPIFVKYSAVDRPHWIRLDFSIGNEFHRCRAGANLYQSET